MKSLSRSFVGRTLGMLAGLLLSASAAQAATIYVYAGSWYVGDGPVWTSNPPVLNALETAALLFGGDPSEFAISTVSSDPNDINFMSYVDGWGDSQFLFTPVAQNYKLDSGNPGYNDPAGGPAYSAFVLDHSCFNRYANPEQPCLDTQVGLNFAFRQVEAVPEPATLLLLGSGLAAAGFRRRRRKA